jgi:P-type E1-E2 ATPase
VVVIDNRYAAALRFRDAPRAESRSFVKHLGPKHQFQRVMIVSGDRESEARYLAEQVGITEIYAQKSPEEKLAIVRKETAVAKTLYVGDGINDAPAMMAATVGMAIGQNSDVTAEAAGVVVMDNSLKQGGRIYAHQPQDATHRPTERSGWYGSERNRHGLCSDRPFESGQRCYHPGSHRHSGRAECVAGCLSS